MRHLVIITLLALLPTHALAQEASDADKELAASIAKCLLAGLPDDWRRAQVVIELAEPGANTGDVRYLFSRAAEAEQLEPFTPCDVNMPARALVQARNNLPPERRNWNVARLLLYRDGKFEIKYDYPK
jgi:hypothetical protein